MSDKVKKVFKHAIYILLTNTIYWFAVYFTYLWLSGFSTMLAFLGNLAFILFGLSLDWMMYRFYESKKCIDLLKKEKDLDKPYRVMQLQLESFVSFRTVLYIFYGIIAIFSQIMVFYPELIGGNIGSFIKANSYSILLLVAFERIGEQFSKDREKAGEILENLKTELSEKQE